MLSSRPVTIAAALVVGVLFVAGLVVDGRGGGLLLAVVAVVLVTLSSATWPRLHPRAKAARGVVIVTVTALAVAKLAGAL